ncbi:vWA domain-containing protein [Paenibacillus eucommiae]|uniref:Ca-activated chloride channel family protein n=1 Tax=Paenibacillus eucommiae TaxID=1355755 RepID=A0ABS4IZH6_9BACL|nr:vWA domain-containing protein [Paenibacillus eucommiae]MBP1992470.1 Ca-activated chloride channel family protein [Paenibacillus eucommiae]
MYQRKINLLLVLFCLIGGVAGFVSGEAILSWGEGRVPNMLLMGMYFGQLALWIGLLSLLAELIMPELNGKGWRLRYAKDGWKLLIPATLLLLLIAGGVGQLVYGLYLGKYQPPRDILMAIDVSESMLQTDPSRDSFEGAKALIQSMEADKRSAIITFNEQAELLQPLVALNDQAAKDEVISKLDAYGPPIGGTNIGAALATSMEQIDAVKGDNRKSMLILISDGYSEVDLEQALAPYRNEQIAISTVGVNASDVQGNNLLRQIASKTGGTYHSVEDVRQLSSVYAKIYEANRSWHLVGERTGSSVDSYYYIILRVLFLLILGALMGLSLGIIFDNRFLAKSFSIGGAIAGLIAGLILEQGLKSAAFSPAAYRAAADIVLAVVLSLSTVMVAYKQGASVEAGSRFYQRSGRKGIRGSSQHQNTHKDFH